jgi:hypothetical protein
LVGTGEIEGENKFGPARWISPVKFCMIFESFFFHNEHLRWNLGWATPNYAGSFLVSLTVFFWAFRQRKIWVAIDLVGEAALYFLLTKTYSRGAFLALGVAAGYFIAARGIATFKEQWRKWLARLVVVGGCVFYTGFFERLAPQHLTDDGAVVNRLSLWRGGLSMVAQSPLGGWGPGESGRAYMNWFQDIDRSEAYTTMVNSYLHIAVEYGLLWLGVILFLLLALLSLGWTNVRRGADERGLEEPPRWLSDAKVSAGACLMAWAIGNLFTTLWIEPRLWIVPSVAIILIVWPASTVSPRRLCWAGLIGGGGAIITCALLFLTGVALSSKQGVNVSLRRDVVLLESSANPTDGSIKVWNVWPDKKVLGRSPGKELRRLFLETPELRCLVVHKAEAKNQDDVYSGRNIILLGEQCERFTAERRGEQQPLQWILVHPTSSPPMSANASPKQSISLLVLLPEIDELGLNAAWRAWAETIGARVIVSPNVGLDIRAAWPEVIQKIAVL